MRKYAVALDPLVVSQWREKARLTAAREKRDLSWVGLLREVMAAYLKARTDENVVDVAPTGVTR